MGFSHFLKDQTANTIFITPPTEATKRNILKELKPKRSYGADNLNNYIINALGTSIVNRITLAINKSMETGQVPKCLEVANVIPIFKQSETDHFVNYRPVSVLPTMPTILEKILHKRLYNYFKIKKFCIKTIWVSKKPTLTTRLF